MRARRIAEILLAVFRTPTVCPGSPDRPGTCPLLLKPLPPSRPYGPRRLLPARIRASLGAWVGFGLLLPSTISATESERRTFDIPAGAATTTLKQFAAQSNEQLLYSPDDVSGVQTQAVRGEFTPVTALEYMLKRTPLKARQDGATKAIAITASPPSRTRPPSPSPDRPSAQLETSSPKQSNPPPMKKRTFLSVVASLVTLGVAGHAQQDPVSFQPPIIPAGQKSNPEATREEIVKLPQFSVTETPVNAYSATRAVSVNRTAGSIIDMPFSVNVITQDFLKDVGAGTAFEATRYLPGISPGRGSGYGQPQDRQNFRGFESFSKTIDNFATQFTPASFGPQSNLDPAFIESIEMIMGPDTILTPTGTPGGAINVTTKSPLFRQQTKISAEVGNYNAQKLVVDTTGPIPIGDRRHWAYRAIVSLQDAKTHLPGRYRQTNGEAALEYVISPTANLTFKYIILKWEQQGALASNGQQGQIVYTPDTVRGATLSSTPQPGMKYDGANGVAMWSSRPETMNFLSARLVSALGSHINMRFAGAVLYQNVGAWLAYPSVTPAETVDEATGEVISVGAWDPTNVTVIGTFQAQNRRLIQWQNDYAGTYHPGPVSLQPVVGWAFQQEAAFRYVTLNNPNMPKVNLYLNNTTPYAPPISQFTQFIANNPNRCKIFQTYGVLRAGFYNDRVFLTGGVSRVWVDVDNYVKTGVYVPGVGQVGEAPTSPTYVRHYTLANTGSPLAPTQKPYRDTYLAGILAKPVTNVSIYGSFSSNSQITAGTNPLWSTGTQFEYGVKAEFFDQRLRATANHSQIIQTNISTKNPLFNTGQSTQSTLLSNQTNHGLEFGLAGGITKELSVMASFTKMHLRDTVGRRLRNVPDTMANLLLNYRFTRGALANLSTVVGVCYQGNVAGATQTNFTSRGVPWQPGFYLAPYTVFNAGASYQWGRYHHSLHVDNVLDSKIWWQPSSRLNVMPYPGLTLRLTSTVRL